MKEIDLGKDTDAKIIHFVNEKMHMHPPLKNEDIERSHRLGPKLDRYSNKRLRPIIVRFLTERTRDVVYKARFRLKDFNVTQPREEKIFINEDLTSIRASLAAKARLIRKDQKIADTWTTGGKVVIKYVRNEIIVINSKADLDKYG